MEPVKILSLKTQEVIQTQHRDCNSNLYTKENSVRIGSQTLNCIEVFNKMTTQILTLMNDLDH